MLNIATQFKSFSPLLTCILACVGAIIICSFTIPKIIYISKRKRLLDVPDNNRKVHANVIPNLGGVGIFVGFVLMTCTLGSMFHAPQLFEQINLFVAAVIVLFVTGLKDDLVGVSPNTKFTAQFIAALIIVALGDLRLTSLHGILGFYGMLPYSLSIGLSVVGCIFITNAFNLIDGIDGLAGSIGVLCCLLLGLGLYLNGSYAAACVAFSLMGAIIGFLKYNLAPAKIFMGDTGALLIGFAVAVLCILFVESKPSAVFVSEIFQGRQGTALFALAVIMVPVFDTFRVFTIRILKGKSPFHADRNHLHHYLLDCGFSHSKAVFTLVLANLLVIVFSLGLQHVPNISIAVVLLFAFAFGLFGILFMVRKRRLELQKSSGRAKRSEKSLNASTISLDRNETIITNYNIGGNKLKIDTLQEA